MEFVIEDQDMSFKDEPDAFMASCFVWHSRQPLLRNYAYEPVTPELEMTAMPPEEPIALNIVTQPGARPKHADALRNVLRLDTDRGLYHAVETSIQTISLEAPPELIRAAGAAALVPNMIVEIDAHAMLQLGRSDLDDAERRYLQGSQYFFWHKRAVRQDIFEIGAEQPYVRPQQPSVKELQDLHTQMYTGSSCLCSLGVNLGHYGIAKQLPWQRIHST